jgi:hypothetical protein
MQQTHVVAFSRFSAFVDIWLSFSRSEIYTTHPVRLASMEWHMVYEIVLGTRDIWIAAAGGMATLIALADVTAIWRLFVDLFRGLLQRRRHDNYQPQHNQSRPQHQNNNNNNQRHNQPRPNGNQQRPRPQYNAQQGYDPNPHYCNKRTRWRMPPVALAGVFDFVEALCLSGDDHV